MKGTFTSTRSIALSNRTMLRADHHHLRFARRWRRRHPHGRRLSESAIQAGGWPGNHNQLAATWTVTFDRPAPLPPIGSLQVFTAQGSMFESGNDFVSRSPQYASWKRVGRREYTATGIVFRFDPRTGTVGGEYQITIDLARNDESFRFQGRATLHNADGNVVASFSVSGSDSGCRSKSNRGLTTFADVRGRATALSQSAGFIPRGDDTRRCSRENAGQKCSQGRNRPTSQI